jgi:hypothetical protein
VVEGDGVEDGCGYGGALGAFIAGSVVDRLDVCGLGLEVGTVSVRTYVW